MSEKIFIFPCCAVHAILYFRLNWPPADFSAKHGTNICSPVMKTRQLIPSISACNACVGLNANFIFVDEFSRSTTNLC